MKTRRANVTRDTRAFVLEDMEPEESLAYDPDQDAAEKRDIRKKYRLLEKKTGGAFDVSCSSSSPLLNLHDPEHLRPQDHDTGELAGQIVESDGLFVKGGIYIHAVTLSLYLKLFFIQ